MWNMFQYIHCFVLWDVWQASEDGKSTGLSLSLSLNKSVFGLREDLGIPEKIIDGQGRQCRCHLEHGEIIAFAWWTNNVVHHFTKRFSSV